VVATLRASPALELSGVSAGYGGTTVLREINLAVPRGAIVGILGANGAGKSTLAAVMAGSLVPTDGIVRLFGHIVTAETPHSRVAKGLALVPESRGIFPTLTVEDNLSVWLPQRAERDRAFERFGILGERRGLPAGELSGGEQQMLALAPLLVRPPHLVIADEPTLGLAPRIAREVIGLLGELRDAGSSVVIVEEKAHHVLDIADVMVFMATGRISWMGAPQQLDRAELAALYLGSEPHHA
jgi:ABC-type branched-subunit amino acid transport system ATPase component